METSPMEHAMRLAAMEWLSTAFPADHLFRYDEIASFTYGEDRIPLASRGRGIWKPARLDAALSIRTAYTAPNAIPTYDDQVGEDGFPRYKYQGNDPESPDNLALRRAWRHRLPVIWWVGVEKGLSRPIFPVWIVADHPEKLEVVLALDESQRFLQPGTPEAMTQKAYTLSTTKRRLHQPMFRSRVLQAYSGKCAICRLRHSELLDAAHIIEDSSEHGQPIVPNGLSLCKIHHAAYDSAILGIRPDLSLHVRTDVLSEVDGPMLRFGIQDLHNHRLEVVPAGKSSRPDPERLEERYSAFLLGA